MLSDSKPGRRSTSPKSSKNTSNTSLPQPQSQDFSIADLPSLVSVQVDGGSENTSKTGLVLVELTVAKQEQGLEI